MPAGGADEPGLDRVLTVPNAVTVVRLLCIPLFLWLLFGADRQTAAAILLGVLGATDWVDGFLARRFHQVSTVGKVLDPAADRILVGTGVIAIMIHGAVPIWFGVATLGPGGRGRRDGARPGRARARSGSTSCGSARPGRSP